MTQQPDVSYPKNIEIMFPEGQYDKEIGSNSPHQEEAIEQECNRPTEKHYSGSPGLRQQINTSEVVHTFLPRYIDLNKVIKFTERKYERESICL